jgi:hypothetical protein
MTEEELRQFTRSVDLIEKLCHKTSRLRGNVVRLIGRIEPFEGEREPVLHEYFEKPKNFREVITLIADTRRVLEDCERLVGKATARIDQIVSDGWSRDDFKPYLKEAARRKRNN